MEAASMKRQRSLRPQWSRQQTVADPGFGEGEGADFTGPPPSPFPLRNVALSHPHPPFNALNVTHATIEYSWFLSKTFKSFIRIPPDPCEESTYREYEPWRKVNSPRVNGKSHCDRYIEEKWYRFNTGYGDSLPQEPVPVGYCGVSFPIWLKG